MLQVPCINRVYTSLKWTSGCLFHCAVYIIAHRTGSKFTTWISRTRHAIALYSMLNNILSLIFYTDLCDTVSTINLTKNRMIFKSGLIPTHRNCNGILVLTSLKMVTWVVETCLLSLCNEIEFIVWGAFISFFWNVYTCTVHFAYKK